VQAVCPYNSFALIESAGATLGTMQRALLIVGKAPQAGSAKTRLVPPLTFADAAALYRGFLLDSVALGLDLGWQRVSVIHPVGQRQALADILPASIRLVEQRGLGLVGALSSAFETHLAEGFERVVLIGSDNPTLPRAPIDEACAALDEFDLTIGPSADGGWYLIGMRERHLGVFDNVEWSTSRVYAQTVSQARRLGLRVHTVQEWYDVDEPDDLDRLQHELVECPPDVATNTRAELGRLFSAIGSRRD
jgi:rSAM/selenodomain-associated transferase 1